MINTKTNTPWGPSPDHPPYKPRPRGGTWDERGPHFPKGPHTGGPEPF